MRRGTRRSMRRGMESSSVLVTMVILLIVILISVGVTLVLRKVFEPAEKGIDCAAEITAHAAAVRFTQELVAPEITCPTKLINLSVDSPAAADPAIAKEMARCWGMWRQGTIQLFGDKEGVYCHVCSVIRVNGANEVQGLAPYLQQTQMKDGRTYAQYLTGQRKGSYFDESQFPPATSALPADKPLAVIFYYAKGQEWYKGLYNDVFGQPGTGAAAGAAVGVGVGVAAGLSWPVVLTVGTAAAAAGGAGSIMSRPDMSYLAMVVVRPLDEERIGDLGCTYLPVGE